MQARQGTVLQSLQDVQQFLERVKPGETIELARTLFTRIGIGGVRHVASVFGEEPSKFDDHRDDS
jgi:hypothetical protein